MMCDYYIDSALAELHPRLKGGDEAAWTTFTTLIASPLLACAVQRTKNMDLAREVVQDTIANLFEFIHDPRDLTFAYCRTALSHMIVEKFRRSHAGCRDVRRTVPLPETHALPCSSEDEGVDVLIQQEEREMLQRGLSQLPVHYRQVIVLRDFEKRSWSSIASLLRMTEGAAAQLYSKRALPKLRNILSQMLGEDGHVDDH